ncbi:MAG: tRNA (adenosine(37)-N6)-threonylcarbamoyltransferase complex ATPase subunit type 1 TsaE [Gammaproteobacteria bacterium]|nr:tRNA (adenosine(37)-N6)-threonylcarbamoyltransferase complex ATPase subunit type 1 TsaE [Gammaproteobacteria bacterium]
MVVTLRWESLGDTEAFAKWFAKAVPANSILFLEGELGAGKTTTTRAILRAAGVEGAIKSPTYTLVESYEVGTRHYHHLDLYRLADPEELDYLGFADLCNSDSTVLIEWAERGEGVLPAPFGKVTLRFDEEARVVTLSGELAALWLQTHQS